MTSTPYTPDHFDDEDDDECPCGGNHSRRNHIISDLIAADEATSGMEGC